MAVPAAVPLIPIWLRKAKLIAASFRSTPYCWATTEAARKDSVIPSVDAIDTAAVFAITSATVDIPAALYPKADEIAIKPSAAFCMGISPATENSRVGRSAAKDLVASSPASERTFSASLVATGPNWVEYPMSRIALLRTSISPAVAPPRCWITDRFSATLVPVFRACIKALDKAAPANSGIRLPHVSHSRLKPDAKPRMAE